MSESQEPISEPRSSGPERIHRDRALADTSDRLLSELRGLRDVERRKREQQISTPEFHELADDAERRARQIWRTAAEERARGDATGEPAGETINSVDVERLGDEDVMRDTTG